MEHLNNSPSARIFSGFWRRLKINANWENSTTSRIFIIAITGCIPYVQLVRHLCVTCVSLVCHLCVTCVSPVCHLCVPCVSLVYLSAGGSHMLPVAGLQNAGWRVGQGPQKEKKYFDLLY